jgi:signal transduction histidine kinase
VPVTTRNTSRLFAAMFAGAYALVLLDRYAAGQLGQAWATLLLSALVVLLGILAFPVVERRRTRWLIAAYFAVQLLLGAAIFGRSIVGGTFLLLVIVAQSVRVLPPWGTLLLGAPLPFLHIGMEWPAGLREGGTFLVALLFLVGFSQAMSNVERARAELDAANRRLRDYAAQSEELATARERNRIAREIHYNRAPAAPAGHSELEPLGLSERELAQLAAFLRTLSGPLATAPEWLAAPAQ